MKIIACQSADEVATQAAKALRRVAEEAREPLKIFVPTGSTPKPLYEKLVAEKKFWAAKLSPIQIDEFQGANALFGEELKKYLLRPLGIEARASMIDPRWASAKMIEHVETILNAGIDAAILGLGPNGHVGFHEPGYPASFAGGALTISPETKNRVAGATTDQVLTFGAAAFLQAREIFLLVTGQGKEKVFREFLTAAPEATILPVAFLKQHPRLTVITDQNM